MMDIWKLIIDNAELGSLAISIGLLIWAFRFNSSIVDVKHLLSGVDGSNGMRGDIKDLKVIANTQGREIDAQRIHLTEISVKCPYHIGEKK